MKQTNIKNLTLTALLISLTYVATAFIKIPIPYGYVNLGFSILILSSFFFGIKNGIIAGSFGSALADLLSPYAMWTIPTFIIKILIALAIGFILYKKDDSKKLYGFKTAIAVFAGSIIHVAGYTFATAILEGNMYSALATAPLLALECIINVMVFYALASVLRKTKITELFQK